MDILGAVLEEVHQVFRWLVGETRGSTYILTCWVFLRFLGLIYLIAFTSFWVQLPGLIGSRGILPARDLLRQLRQELGWERYRLIPTILWLRAEDPVLHAVCGAGVGASILLVAGVAPAPCLVVLWVLYLSLCSVSRDFMAFQWDVLLLETGFLAIFLAPWGLSPSSGGQDAVPPLSLFLLWWLLFRLMFESGVVKLTSGDPTWRNLTALDYHYFTQPLPNPISWLFFQLSPWFHRLSVVVMYLLEIGFPFLIFGPREARILACAGLVLLQILIFLTGNYNFFNLLAIALCVLLLDDGVWRQILPGSFVAWLGEAGPDLGSPWRLLMALPWAVILLPLSFLQICRSLRPGARGPTSLRRLETWLAPFRSINAYGLFRVMTVTRPEIVVEGSRDGVIWETYEFRYKPGEVRRRPRFVAPHQPRLDWQMWFAALRSFETTPWFQSFLLRLLQGSPVVRRLLRHNPFPADPPRYLRALLYNYRFTTWREWRKTGAWWHRELLGAYSPVVTHMKN